VEFYTHPDSGRCPVEEFIARQPTEQKARLLNQLGRLEESWGSARERVPGVTKLEAGLWELTVGQYRLVFTDWGEGKITLLHGFLKRSRKTPREELARCRQRLVEVKSR
jgi:phage-related protein